MTPKEEMIEFLKSNRSCADGFMYAVENCESLAECWEKAKPEWLIWLATCDGVLDDRTQRLFACWCVRNTPLHDGRKVWDLLDDSSRNLVEVAERYAGGLATRIELDAARDAARDAAWAARDSARDYARAATWYAARDYARDAAWAAAWAAQAEYIRSNVPNPFKE